MEVEYISTLACDEFEEEEEDDSREWISQEDSNLSFSQIEQQQGEVAETMWGCAGKEEEGADMELNEKEDEDRNARREDKLKRRAQEKEKEKQEKKNKKVAVRVVYNTGIDYNNRYYCEEDEQMEEEMENEIEKERRKTSAMMLRTTAKHQQEPTGQEEEEEEEQEKDRENQEREAEKRTNRGNSGEKNARRREILEMGLDDDIQLDFVEVFKIMLEKEKQCPRRFHWPAHLHPTRGKLIDWLSQMGEEKNLDLADRTIHLSVDILDAVHAEVKTVVSLYLAALAALLIAAKHEEVEEKVPTIEELIIATGNRFNQEHLIGMELWVLNKIEWQVMRLTSVLFLENYVRRGACTIYAQDLFNGQHIQPNKVASMEGYLNRYANFFCDVCLQDVELSGVAHSLIAAASLACARRALKLSPDWPESLKEITTYENDQLASVAQKMWTIYLNTTQQ